MTHATALGLVTTLSWCIHSQVARTTAAPLALKRSLGHKFPLDFPQLQKPWMGQRGNATLALLHLTSAGQECIS